MNLTGYNSFLQKDINNAVFRGKVALNYFENYGWPDSLLDIGCGSGELLKLAENKNIKHLFGVDGVKEALESCQGIQAVIKQVDLNNEKLPFPDDFFNGVTCLEVLEHLYAPQSIISEIYRVLQPGRWAVISVPNPYHLLMRLRILFGANASAPEVTGGHIKFFRTSDIQKMCSRGGFDEVHLEGIPSPRSLRKYKGLTARLGKLAPDLFATWFFICCHKPVK